MGSCTTLTRYCCLHCPAVGKACVYDESKQRRNLEKIRKCTTAFFSLGDMREYTGTSDNSLYYWPVDVAQVPYVGVREDNAPPLRIVHATNHRRFKETVYLERAVEDLKRRGLPIEFQSVERVLIADALKIYAGADIVAEQFLIGWHGFKTIEAMAMGGRSFDTCESRSTFSARRMFRRERQSRYARENAS